MLFLLVSIFVIILESYLVVFWIQPGLFFVWIGKHFVYTYFRGIPGVQLATHHRRIRNGTRHFYIFGEGKLKYRALYFVMFFMLSQKLKKKWPRHLFD